MENNTTNWIYGDYEAEDDGDFCPRQEVIFLPVVQTIFVITYIIIGVVGFFTNLIVITTIVSNRDLWSNTNVFICNMCASDLIICLTAVPLTPLSAFSGWHFGRVACIILPACQGASVYISSLTLAAIAVERYLSIHKTSLVRSNTQRHSLRRTILIIIAVDLVSILCVTPFSYHMEWKQTATSEYCAENWDGEIRLVYGIFMIVSQVILPSLVCAVASRKILLLLRKHSNSLKQNLSNTSHRIQAERRRNRRRTHIVISILILFVVCWLPLNLVNLVEDFGYKIYCWRYYYFVFFSFHTLATSSACFNPIFYGWLNSNIRSDIKQHFTNFKSLFTQKNVGQGSLQTEEIELSGIKNQL